MGKKKALSLKILCTRVYIWACERNCIYVKVNLHTYKYTPAQTRCIFAFTYNLCILYIYSYVFWSCERAANIHTYANVSFPLISSKIGIKNKMFLCLNRKILLNHSHFRTIPALGIKFHAHYVFTKIVIFIYNNAQIHPNVTVQYLKSIPFVQKA